MLCECFQSSFHMNLHSISCSYLVLAPCCFITTAPPISSSSTYALIFSQINCLFSLPCALLNLGTFRLPSPALYLSTAPTSILWCNQVSAPSTAASALHFHPAFSVTFASANPLGLKILGIAAILCLQNLELLHQ